MRNVLWAVAAVSTTAASVFFSVDLTSWAMREYGPTGATAATMLPPVVCGVLFGRMIWSFAREGMEHDDR